MKRLSLPSGLTAAVLAVSSCAEIAMVPVAAVALPLTAAFMIGFAGVATLSQVQEGFDTQQRKREEKPRKDGPFLEYWPNGNKRAAGSYKDKKLNGLYTTYYKNGRKKSEVIYEFGERNGPHTSWHENGQKSLEGVFKGGKPEGTTRSYHKNGRISHLESGSPNGTNTAWHENGQKQRVSTYKNGKLISRKVWNEKGKLTESLRRASE
mgnify:CR=1 FL=1